MVECLLEDDSTIFQRSLDFLKVTVESFCECPRHAGVSMAPQLSQKGGISPAAIAVSSRAFVCSFPTRFFGRRFISSAMTASEVGISLMSPAQVFDLCRPLPAGSLAATCGSWEKALISSSICRALGTGAGANFGDDMLTREAGREDCARENAGFGGADSLVGIGAGVSLRAHPPRHRCHLQKQA